MLYHKLNKIDAKKKKVFEAYEDEIISNKDSSERRVEIQSREELLQHYIIINNIYIESLII